MDISLGFIIISILIILPGLLFRRLYFFGEFSKQFNAGYNVTSQIALSVIPGISIFILVFFVYHKIYQNIEIESIINKIKEINNPESIQINKNKDNLTQLLINQIAPFIIFLFASSAFSGVISGRLIRITKLDNRFKVLRFRNFWFYSFSGENLEFEKFKHLSLSNKNRLFTQADILIDQNGTGTLFSGIVVDYELSIKDGTTLSKVYLSNAHRYKKTKKKTLPILIPGDIFIVECDNIKNINLKHIFEKNNEKNSILQSKIPQNTELIFALLIISFILIIFFKLKLVDYKYLNLLFELEWYKRILPLIFIVQTLYILIPFTKNENFYQFVTCRLLLSKITIAILLFWLTYVLII